MQQITHNGELYGLQPVKLDEVKSGDTLYADSNFSCMSAGMKTVYANSNQHLCVPCTEGDHVLDAQLSFDDDQTLVGLYRPVPVVVILTLERTIAAALQKLWGKVTSKTEGTVSLINLIMVWDTFNETEKKHIMAEVKKPETRAFLTAWDDMAGNPTRPTVEEVKFFMETMIVTQPQMFEGK